MLSFILFQSEVILPRIGQVEQISVQALSLAVIWVLWKAFREKDQQLQDFMRRMIESDMKQAAALDRVESLLQSGRRLPALPESARTGDS